MRNGTEDCCGSKEWGKSPLLFVIIYSTLIPIPGKPEAAVIMMAATAEWTPNSQPEELRSRGLGKKSHCIFFSLNLIIA